MRIAAALRDHGARVICAPAAMQFAILKAIQALKPALYEQPDII
jgi:hypothetical protein